MTLTRDRPQYVFLMRHAKHDEGHLTKDGLAHIRSLATRFSEWLLAEWRSQPERTIRVWFTSTAPEVRETADALAVDVLAHRRQRHGQDEPNPFDWPPNAEHKAGESGNGRQPWMPVLVPSSLSTGRDGPEKALSAYSPDEPMFRNLCTWLKAPGTGRESARRAGTDAPLLVGNDPLIGWVTANLTGRGTPVARGELVCLVLEPRARARWRLLWTISDDDETEAEAIRAKVKSKMNTAGALGTVIVGLTTFLLQNSAKTPPDVWQWLAFAALATSAGLYFATLFLYDTMQMPPRFWSHRFPSRPQGDGRPSAIWGRLRHGHPTVIRPPAATARVLQTSMVQVWTWVFTPATVLAGIGVACLAVGVSGDRHPVALAPWQVLAAIVVLAGAVGIWVAWHRPDLGASD